MADPDNAANKVAKVNRSATAAVWAGTTVSTGAGASVPPIPFTATKKKMTVRVRSPLAAGTHVRLKVEDHTNGAISCETEALTTQVNAWQALTFDFASPAGAALDLSKTYDKVSIFFDFGVDGPTAGAQTFYFDDVAFPSFDPITFDDVAVTYTLTGFGGAEDSTVATDPDGVHTSNHVAKVNRSATAAVWAGTTVSTGAGASVPRVPFTLGETRMTVRVYSPTAAGTHVRLKVEDHTNGAITCETEALTTQVNGWETLTFNFANAAGAALDLSKTYDKVSIFFDFGVDGATAGARTYYFDDVSFVP